MSAEIRPTILVVKDNEVTREGRLFLTSFGICNAARRLLAPAATIRDRASEGKGGPFSLSPRTLRGTK